MKKLFNISLIGLLFSSCSSSNGEIQYRQKATPCVKIKEFYVDTTHPESSPGYEEYAAKTKLRDQNLKKLLERKDQIEKESNEIFLVNKSTSHIVTFTVKSTSDDINKTTSTKLYKANPGEQILIGCDSYITYEFNLVKQKCEIVGETKK